MMPRFSDSRFFFYLSFETTFLSLDLKTFSRRALAGKTFCGSRIAENIFSSYLVSPKAATFATCYFLALISTLKHPTSSLFLFFSSLFSPAFSFTSIRAKKKKKTLTTRLWVFFHKFIYRASERQTEKTAPL